MDQKNILRFLSAPPPREIGILGDFCVDVYWELAPEKGELSLETGLKTTPVGTARYGLGGAGNIVANLRALGVLHTPCFGAVGRDPFGLWLHRELMEPDPEPEIDYKAEYEKEKAERERLQEQNRKRNQKTEGPSDEETLKDIVASFL